MLCYLTTDAVIDRAALNDCLSAAIGNSFNRITVDGDTSTNDTVLVLANGAAGNDEIKAGTPECAAFGEALQYVMADLAKRMVLDGEGVSKFVEVNVHGAASKADAKTCAEAIANSALCKTAWFGADPNWGRILCAAGYCGISFDPSKADLFYDGVPVVRGGVDAGTPEADLVKVLKRRLPYLIIIFSCPFCPFCPFPSNESQLGATSRVGCQPEFGLAEDAQFQ